MTPTFTQSRYLTQCIRSCGRWFIPSVEAIAVQVEQSDSPVTDQQAVDEGFDFCLQCAIGEDALEYPYDYFLTLVWPVVRNAQDAQYNGGWVAHLEGFLGSIVWTRTVDDVAGRYSILATPFWDETFGIAVQVDDADGTVAHGTLPWVPTGNPEEDAAAYLAAMSPYLQGLTDGLEIAHEEHDLLALKRTMTPKGGR